MSSKLRAVLSPVASVIVIVAALLALNAPAAVATHIGGGGHVYVVNTVKSPVLTREVGIPWTFSETVIVPAQQEFRTHVPDTGSGNRLVIQTVSVSIRCDPSQFADQEMYISLVTFHGRGQLTPLQLTQHKLTDGRMSWEATFPITLYHDGGNIPDLALGFQQPGPQLRCGGRWSISGTLVAK